MQTRFDRIRTAAPPARPARPSAPGLRQDVRLFAAVALSALVLGAALQYGLRITNPDSIARTVNAVLVLFSRDPHLGAIGFVWPPLPTFARMPVLLALQPVGLAAFAGPVTSALFAGGVAAVLNRLLRGHGFAGEIRAAWIGLALLNPLVVLHFVNGTAESAYTFFLLAVVVAAGMLRTHPTASVLLMAIAAAGAMATRYEALALVGMCVLGLLVAEVDPAGGRGGLRPDRLSARLVLFASPVAFVLVLWLGFNWSIQGDPLFFFRSAYSVQNAPEVARNDPGHVLRYAYGSLPGATQYVLDRSMAVSLAFVIGGLATLWKALRRQEADGYILALLCLSVPGMQWYQAYSGTIPPFLRYWVYLPVLAVPLWGYVLRPRDGSFARRWWLAGLIIPALLLASNAATLFAMTARSAGVDEQIVALALTGRADEAAPLRALNADAATLEEIADYLDQRPGLLLLDLDRGGPLLLMLDSPARLVVNADSDFQQIMRDPPARGVGWVLLPDPSGRSEASLARDSIYSVLPSLYEGAPWLTLDREFAGPTNWRLYRVTRAR